MADISEWSPVDESNTAAPPNGFPEFMAVSGLNNGCRALMGAVRRWYDTITAQVNSLTTSLAGYLPLWGGTVTGTLVLQYPADLHVAGTSYFTGNIEGVYLHTTGNINSDSTLAAPVVNTQAYDLRGVPFATLDAGFNFLQIADGVGANLTLYGYAATNYYDNNVHYLRSRGGGETFAIFNTGGSFNENGSWGVISDAVHKSDVQSYGRGLSAIQALRPVSFRYSSGPFAGERRHYGLVAQEMQTVVPEMVGEADLDGERMLTMQPGHLVFVLCNAVQELAARLQALEEKSDV